MKKLILAFVLFLAVAGALFLGYREALKRAWIRYNEYDIRSEGVLKVGDPAPDLELFRVEGDSRLRLSELYSLRPVVLVFGSYT